MCECKGPCDFRDACDILDDDTDSIMRELEDALDGPDGDDLVIPIDCPFL